MLTNYERYIRDIKSKIAMAKVAFNTKNTMLTVTVDLGFRNKLVQRMKHSFVWR